MLRVTGTRLVVTRLSTVACVARTLPWQRVSVNVCSTRSERCATGQWTRCYATAIGQQRCISCGSRRPDLSLRSRWRTALAVGTAFGTYGVCVALARRYSLAVAEDASRVQRCQASTGHFVSNTVYYYCLVNSLSIRQYKMSSSFVSMKKCKVEVGWRS